MPAKADLSPAVEIKLLETITDMEMVEQLCLQIWPGSERDVIPAHLLLTIAKSGGWVLGAFSGERMMAFVFGFLGMRSPGAIPALKHCSHQLGVHPDYQSSGIGFKLKRAQWQMVRQQGLELITWTFDPLLSLNARLNIAKLGGVANTYLRELYGHMRDGLNQGLPSDRLQVDWWVNSPRVLKRLSADPRPQLDLAHFLAADVPHFNRTRLESRLGPVPEDEWLEMPSEDRPIPVVLFEIPADFSALKAQDMSLAARWKAHTRQGMESLFSMGYIITDFIYLPGSHPRSFYVFSYGDGTLGEET